MTGPDCFGEVTGVLTSPAPHSKSTALPIIPQVLRAVFTGTLSDSAHSEGHWADRQACLNHLMSGYINNWLSKHWSSDRQLSSHVRECNLTDLHPNEIFKGFYPRASCQFNLVPSMCVCPVTTPDVMNVYFILRKNRKSNEQQM